MLKPRYVETALYRNRVLRIPRYRRVDGPVAFTCALFYCIWLRQSESISAIPKDSFIIVTIINLDNKKGNVFFFTFKELFRYICSDKTLLL